MIPSQGFRKRSSTQRNRRGFTLLELMLSLFLTTIVAVLMGGLIQLYLINESRGRESVRQSQTARAILNMIAEDIRTTVRHQQFDTSGLQQMLSGATSSMGGGLGAMAAGGGMTGGGMTGAGGASAGGAAGGASSGGVPGGSAPGGSATGGNSAIGGAAGGASQGGGMAGGSAGGMSGGSGSSTPTAVSLPGVYGSASAIEIDVSRMPRPDEYVIQMGDVSTGALGDMPSDIKTVGYYVQAPRADGVSDPLARLTAESQTASQSASNTGSSGMSGGLVRRSLDRAVTQFAYQNGRSDQLSRTGEIVAPEVLGIEFSYFNASSGWQTEWDSSQLGLPHVIKVTLAMQSESKARSNPLAPGISLSTINSGMISEYGIQIYSINVLIPGSALLSAPSPASGTGTSSNGMSSLGL